VEVNKLEVDYDISNMPSFTYLMLVPGEEKDRRRCLKAMREMSKSNFYYCNINTPANILKFQPIVKGENYNLEMLITLNKEYMAS
jgi:hypothetical protein